MTNDFSKVLSLVKSDTIAGNQTSFIDSVLVRVTADQIPKDYVLNVIRYIDLQLANNEVSQETRNSLVHLYDELSSRNGKA